MANINEDVVFVVSGKDQTGAAFESAKAGLSSLNDKSRDVAAQMDQHWQTFKENWKGVAAAFWGALETIKKAWSMAEMAATYNEQMQLLDALARKYGTTAVAITDKIREIGEGMISMTTAAEAAASALGKGLKPEMLLGLAEAALTLKDIMKTTADDAFKRLTEAMETGREKSIKLAVGVIDLKDRYGEMADKMTETEKQAALYNIIMERVHAIQAQTAGSTKTVADEMETFIVTLKNLQLEMGQGLIRAGAGAMGVLQTLAAGALTVVQAYSSVLKLFYELRSAVDFGAALERDKKAIAEYQGIAQAAAGASAELVGKAEKNFALMTASTADLTRATAAHAAAIDTVTMSEGARQKAIAETTKMLEAYSKVVQKYGEDALKMGKDAFGETLKAEAATIDQLKKGMGDYLAIIKSVYEARIAGEKAVADAMAAAGAKQKDQLEAQAQILKTEKDGLTARLDAYRTYYDTLVAKHKEATDKMKTLTSELASLETKLAEARNSAVNNQINLQQKLFAAQGQAADSKAVYDMKQAQAQDVLRQAMISTGETQIKYLDEYIKLQSQMTDKVVEYGKTRDIWTGKEIQTQKDVQTAEESIRRAMEDTNLAESMKVQNIQSAVNAKKAEMDANKEWISQLKGAMDQAKTMMDAYSAQISALSDIIANMAKVIALTVNDTQAVNEINRIQTMLKAIPDETVNIKLNYMSQGGVPGGAGGGGNTITVGKGGPGDPYIVGGPTDSSGTSRITSVPGPYPYIVYGPDGSPTITNVGGGGGGTYQSSYNVTSTPGGGPGDLTYSPISGGGLGPGDYFGAAIGGYAFGTRMVPRTGRYILHEGEQVLTKNESNSNQTINFNPTININGTNKSPEQLAKEIIKPLYAELRNLNVLRG